MNAKKIIYLLLFILWASSMFASMAKSQQTLKTPQKSATAVNVKTQYIQAGKNKIAYRTIGSGNPLILCNRLRGILDTWDPLFLDNLAKNNKVIIFDYPGIGLSSGNLAPTMLGVATDVKQFAAALKLSKFRLLGWSYGGAVAQSFAAHFPEMVSHLILIGANPPGQNETPYEQAFLDAAFKPVNDLQDEEVLFFEPNSAKSRAAAKASNQRIAARKTDRSIMVTPEKFGDYFKGVADYQKDENNSREKLSNIQIPILVIIGDHDPSCPVQNWFPLSKKWKTMRLIVIPSSGHGVQHEFPKYISSQIELFVEAS